MMFNRLSYHRKDAGHLDHPSPWSAIRLRGCANVLIGRIQPCQLFALLSGQLLHGPSQKMLVLPAFPANKLALQYLSAITQVK